MLLRLAELLGLFILAAIVWVGLAASCATPARTSTLRSLASPSSAAKMQVSARSGGGTYGMERLDLVGTSVEFTIAAAVGGRSLSRRFRLPLGGASNAWLAVGKAKIATMTAASSLSSERYVLWSAGDHDQWWDNPAAEAFLRSIATGDLQELP